MPSREETLDPWSQVEDIDGDIHYRTLGVPPSATAAEIKKAFRTQAKVQHPDKGGDADQFGRLQRSFEILSDPKKRAVYDTWAKELQFRYAPGGEDLLLDEFEGLGLHCDPGTQLVVTCEVCGRPSTKDCWTCGMKICDFCTLKRHWKDDFPLHWPLVNSDHMATRLAKRELEKKRIEDAHRLALEDPNHRNETELRNIRAFTDAACRMAAREDRLVAYDYQLARFYMWAQTEYHVIVAVHVPTGYEDKALLLDCTQASFILQPVDSPPVIERALAYGVDVGTPVETYRTPDNRLFTAVIPKGAPGEAWERLFRGDSDGLRGLKPPYRLTETDDDVTMEIELPFWIDATDVRVHITDKELCVDVRNTLSLRRVYWRNRGEEAKRPSYSVVDVEESLWSLDEEDGADGQPIKMLMITLVKPPLSDDEVQWKKGRRQDNRAQDRAGNRGKKGFRFFQDDEDEFELEDILMALCFSQAGTSWVPSKPWEFNVPSKYVKETALLPERAQEHLKRLLQPEASAEVSV